MAYSRWSNSIWYTFWTTRGHGEHFNDQLLSVNSELCFSYKELSKDIKKCLEEVVEHYKSLDDNCAHYCSDDAINELQIYMERFIEDVQDCYHEKILEYLTSRHTETNDPKLLRQIEEIINRNVR